MLFRQCCGTVSTTLSLQDSKSPEIKSSTIAQQCPWSNVPEWLNDAIREYLVKKDTSSSTVMGTFKSKSGEQLNTCWSFISPEYEVKNRLSWITKIEPELMMKVSLVLSVRQLHDGKKHLLSESKISSFKNLEKEELIFGDNGIVRMSNFSYLAEKQNHWLHKTLILMIFEITSLAATENPFNSSMTNCSTSAAYCWELELNGAWRDSEILRVRVHKKFDGSTGLLDLDYIFMFRVIDLRSGVKDGDSDGTPFQSNEKTLSVCRMAFA